MTMACPATSGIVSGVVDAVDCNIRVLVHQTYRDLVGPGTVFAGVLTAMLTIYVALIGYQLLLGRGQLRLTALPVSALKIGLIMAFLTSWAAYQTVIFAFLFDGPRELVGVFLSPMGFGADVYDAIERAYAVLTGAAGIYGGQADPAANILQGGPMLGSGLLWLSAIGLLLLTVGVVLAAKIVLGFLLALGPVFVALFLFDTTRGLFDGWLRASLAFALAPLAANVFGAAMLLMLSPFLTALSENAAAETFDMGPIVTIALIVCVFGIVTVMALRAGATIAGGFVSGSTRDLREERTGAAFAPGLISPRPGEAAAAVRTEAPDLVQAASVRRTDIVRETTSFERTAPSERLGQAYRRVARAPLTARVAL
jgi:type IV secretion system protein VirB6